MKSNIEWLDWGKRDPLFGAASWPNRERDGNHPWTDEAFYALGESDWTDFRKRLDSYGLDTARCIKIGCGPGRMTRSLARTFAQVDAIDISEEMLAYAASHIDASNVTFHKTDGMSIPLPDQIASAVFSTHVLQHLDTREGAASYLREAFRVLHAGGTIMIHAPLHRFPFPQSRLARFYRELYRIRRVVGDVRAARARAQIRSGKSVGLMRGLSYEVDWLIATLGSMGYRNIEFAIFPLTSNGDYHPCVFAAK